MPRVRRRPVDAGRVGAGAGRFKQIAKTWMVVMDFWQANATFTLPETNIFAPENGRLEDYFPIGKVTF